jgi:aflatoxin B1 aldehyde reductase
VSLPLLTISVFALSHIQAPKKLTPTLSQVAVGKLYRDWFFKEDLFSAANQVHTAAQKDGISGHAVALRWILHHSALDAKLGDGIIIGASSLPPLEENLQICKAGPLPSHLVQMVDEIGGKIRDQAPPHSF